ncbi:thiosulfate sulfurtransferase 16, chloroplastic-like isoform X2 [Phoenix dactylifera]|uniref:Thiosulfate sulfurtransferase 16, chloroplastic-like isoform X2 n=1 Tax=Phoenix dactylifera TaxID=42345 RepID=A0A8B7BLW3_PHODC|nr:thiosulfate sulfurtransferase 16, chloroplastic-like isoform X2 [Phoenix dactylifera]
MASYSRFSLPLLISHPPPKRFLSLSPTVLSASKQCGLQHALSRTENGWRGFLRNGSPEIVVPRSVPVRVAHELLQAGHRYLDVRTADEFNAGHAVGAKNIPYVFKVGSGFAFYTVVGASHLAAYLLGIRKNPNFLKEVLQVFEEDDEIIIGCESGRRSLMAAAELSSAGFTGITDIGGGYSAWLQNGLPTEQ